MTFIKSLKDNKSKPSIKLLIILLIFVIYLVFSYIWSVKSDVYAYDFLPRETVFYYEWPDKGYFELKPSQNIDLFDLSEPNGHLTDIKVLFGNKFVDAQEILWFKINKNDEDYYLLRFRSLSDKFVQDLQVSAQGKYKLRKVEDNILLVYKDVDLELPDLLNGNFAINHIKEGNNIYWQIGKEPKFLVDFSNNIKSFVKFKELHLNIKENSLNLFQIYNEEQFVDDEFSKMLLLQDFDLLVALRASSTETIENYLGNQIIMPNFNKLPYANLTQDKFNDYFLKNSLLWQKEEDWLLVRTVDWWPLITDLASSLDLEEKNKVLPDGTAYIELIIKENQLTQHFQYLEHDLWQIDGLFGAQIGDNFYLSNSRQILEGVISQKTSLKSLTDNCMSSSDYEVLDVIWWDNDKLQNIALKDYLLSKNINDLKIFSYQNSIIRGINWCF